MRFSVSLPGNKKRIDNFFYFYVNLSSLSRNYKMHCNNPSLSISELKATAHKLLDKAATDNHANFIAVNIGE